jgi:dTDP-4-amino-4,6-dideoxygalactose transaminase
MNIPFCQAHTSSQSAKNVQFLVDNPSEIAKNSFTKQCIQYFEELYPGYKALIVSSCTRALDLIALSLNLGANDEIVMPSFNYVGVANAFAQTGAKLVFADVDVESMNISAASVEKCLSPNTKAVLAMNYAGVGSDLVAIKKLCAQKKIIFIEDNAQGIGAYLGDKLLGGFGDFSCISFDSVKNISCGEGGVILYRSQFEESIETVFNNGTNRVAFEKGAVEAYEWVVLGSKFAISEYNAAILLPLLQSCDSIIQERRDKWNQLYDALAQVTGLMPCLPKHMRGGKHNAHIFFIKLPSNHARDSVMNYLQGKGVSCSFHYTPLHSSQMGLAKNFKMIIDSSTTLESDKLLRLPVFNALTKHQISYIISTLKDAIQYKS